MDSVHDDDSQDSRSPDSRRPAVLLWSGGLDSTTVLAIARSEGFEPTALIFRYGQRHAVEVENALRNAARLRLACHTIDIDLRSVGGSALTSDAILVPQDRPDEELLGGPIPVTYVPARNTIFLSYALAWAEVLDAADIFIGVNALDYSGYPDCRPEYLRAFETLANLACRSTTEGGTRLRIHAPLVDKTKAEIISWGMKLGVDYSMTWSCYSPEWIAGEPIACGRCDSCRLRAKGFEEAGVPDPTRYRG